jgi:mono/diheme cytochrome c family protein
VDFERAEKLYQIYCGICHGNKGKGQGNLVKREKILGVPSYGDRDITLGSIYHTMYYGKNAMGSYANQIDEEERWQVAAYVMKLRAEIKK